MHPMIQTKVSKKEARKFVEYMSKMDGYEAIKDACSSSYVDHWYFKKDGETSLHYSVCISGPDAGRPYAYIGVRPI